MQFEDRATHDLPQLLRNAAPPLVQPRSGKCQDINVCSARIRRNAQYALERLLGRLQISLPCVHRYAKVWICVGPPEIKRVETHTVEPLRVFTLAEGVAVRENVAAM